jgi:hypothetical protein
MTVFRKFEVCASYEHLWLNRHLRQAAKRCSAILNPLQNNENSYFDLVQNDIKS